MSRKAFGVGLAFCLLLVAQLGALIHQLNAGHHRPEGVAEDWLQAAGDLGRDGVRQDAADRLRELGAQDDARRLVTGVDTGGDHAALADLEVGDARTRTRTSTSTSPGDDVVRVPFAAHRYDEDEELRGTLVLHAVPDGHRWHVDGTSVRAPGERVPSEGGGQPSSAPASLWVTALLVGGGIALFASFAVRAAAVGGGDGGHGVVLRES